MTIIFYWKFQDFIKNFVVKLKKIIFREVKMFGKFLKRLFFDTKNFKPTFSGSTRYLKQNIFGKS
jgi:hypothetical protein